MKVAYVSGRYNAQNHDELIHNIILARTLAHHLWQQGWSVICPHMNSALMGGVVPEEQFLEGYRELVKRSDMLALLPNSAASNGAMAELATAILLRKEIRTYRLTPEGWRYSPWPEFPETPNFSIENEERDPENEDEVEPQQEGESDEDKV